MCGRIDQRQAGIEYAMRFAWERLNIVNASEAPPRVNASPGTYRPVIHLDSSELRIDDVFWGYRPIWAAPKKIPIAMNARVEKITNGYWKKLLASGRCIVPADGWYEWTVDEMTGKKLPWHIHLKTREPLFMAGIAQFGVFIEHRAEAGFAIVTADAVGGMVDVHDRRPVVLDAEAAATWLSQDFSPEEAQHFLHVAARPSEDFDWYRVDVSVNDARNEAEGMDLPINPDPELH